MSDMFSPFTSGLCFAKWGGVIGVDGDGVADGGEEVRPVVFDVEGEVYVVHFRSPFSRALPSSPGKAFSDSPLPSSRVLLPRSFQSSSVHRRARSRFRRWVGVRYRVCITLGRTAGGVLGNSTFPIGTWLRERGTTICFSTVFLLVSIFSFPDLH